MGRGSQDTGDQKTKDDHKRGKKPPENVEKMRAKRRQNRMRATQQNRKKTKQKEGRKQKRER